MILYGPPGSGKTTLARIIAAASGAAFEELSAIEAGLPEVRAVLERARHRGGGTVFFLDEIHRFSRPQQDALLRAVEEGVVVLIGATTESPRHQVSGALLSRLRVYEVDPLDASDLRALIERAQARGELGRGPASTPTPSSCWRRARRATHASRSARSSSRRSGRQRVDIEAASSALETALVRYDATADRHYETISAWIKATRGSDPDASLYYLATMLEGGEDPRFIARRMVIFASEDVGNADPAALTLAAAAAQAVELVGLPECTYALAQAAIYLSLAPKSNAAGSALAAAREEIRTARRRPPAGAAAPERLGLRLPARAPRPRQPAGADAGRASRARGSTSPARPRRSSSRRSPPSERRAGAGDEHAGRRRRARVAKPGDARAARQRHADAAAADAARIVAEVAAVTPLWAQLRVADRARYLERAAQAVIDEFDDLAASIAAESGRPLAEIAALELLAAIDTLQWLAHNARRLLSARSSPLPRAVHPLKRASAGHAPLGVVAVIGAGSSPFAGLLVQTGAALLGGNGVVVKPALRGAQAGERIAGVLARAGFPEGVVRVVQGGGPLGGALSACAGVAHVSFAGSSRTAAEVAAACAARGRKQLARRRRERSDGRPRRREPRRRGRRRASGQHAPAPGSSAARSSAFTSSASATTPSPTPSLPRLQALTIGDPLDPATELGPLASAGRRELLEQAIATACASGATRRSPAAEPAPRGAARRVLRTDRAERLGGAAGAAARVPSGPDRRRQRRREPCRGRRARERSRGGGSRRLDLEALTAVMRRGSRASCELAWSGATTTSSGRCCRATLPMPSPPASRRS